ncbi:MAG TPA: ABC transporter permease [Candidatus Gallibacteroides avistercoris]|uniref:ABC transporter permease n=1 Tax=Candidatus Gallibacteroides avistercoris TaxID=2840833 RepID=A0A9D1M7U2_9BACT|nr:ABC transporter permease [Candidatus Gallibacteroides avistercoris]
MNLPLKIAKRYLVSKKSHSVINIISLVSVCGIAIASMALVCVLSVFNGFQDLIASLFSTIDPQIKVIPIQGKTFDASDPAIQEMAQWPEIAQISPVIEENVLLIYGDRQVPALLKGVTNQYEKQTRIDDIIIDGHFLLHDTVTDYATIGVGLANSLATGAGFRRPLMAYVPKRKARINMANPSSSLSSGRLFMTAVFRVNQAEYDDQLAIVPIDFARRLFDYTTEASALEITLQKNANEANIMERIQGQLGDNFEVKNRIEQKEASFKMVQIEKWMSYLILGFILMIASFNAIGSLSMLIIDKKADIDTLKSLGADNRLISRIFLTEGWLISAVGAVTGIIIGILLCWGQQTFGWIKLGEMSEAFIIEAYPVSVQLLDIAAVLALVLLLGFFTAWYPVRYLKNIWMK